MERHCKNCNSQIYANKNYCADCGAKWIDNRITMKQVAADFGDLYIGFDTKFIRTFVDLCVRPERVILGYISGRRANYMDAIRYLLLVLFVVSIYTFVIKKTDALEHIVPDMSSFMAVDLPPEKLEELKQQNQQIQDAVFDYQGLFYFITIPLFAFIGRIVFWGKRYFNFPEQMVFFMYTLSHVTLISTIFSIIIVLLHPETMLSWSVFTYFFMSVYNIASYKRCFNLSWGKAVLKFFQSLLYLFLFFLLIGILIAVFTIITVVVAKKF
ncbi:MAG: DUF3667 domain-containing protein [Nonlabens sp.]